MNCIEEYEEEGKERKGKERKGKLGEDEGGMSKSYLIRQVEVIFAGHTRVSG